MKLIWRFFKEEKLVEAVLKYNVYTGKKEIFIDSEKLLTLKGPNGRKQIDFKYNDENYSLDLTHEGYGYAGYIILPDGKKIAGETEEKKSIKIPLWTIPFLIINILIPIVSVEAAITWAIGILACILTVKAAAKEEGRWKFRYTSAVFISIGSWVAFYVFYLLMRHAGGIKLGFLPFMK